MTHIAFFNQIVQWGRASSYKPPQWRIRLHSPINSEMNTSGLLSVLEAMTISYRCCTIRTQHTLITATRRSLSNVNNIHISYKHFTISDWTLRKLTVLSHSIIINNIFTVVYHDTLLVSIYWCINLHSCNTILVSLSIKEATPITTGDITARGLSVTSTHEPFLFQIKLILMN